MGSLSGFGRGGEVNDGSFDGGYLECGGRMGYFG